MDDVLGNAVATVTQSKLDVEEVLALAEALAQVDETCAEIAGFEVLVRVVLDVGADAVNDFVVGVGDLEIDVCSVDTLACSNVKTHKNALAHGEVQTGITLGV